MLKAYCKRLSDRAILVGDTVFPFDSSGYCEVKDTGFVYRDFVNLLKMHGVVEMKEKKEEISVDKVSPPAPIEEKVEKPKSTKPKKFARKKRKAKSEPKKSNEEVSKDTSSSFLKSWVNDDYSNGGDVDGD